MRPWLRDLLLVVVGFATGAWAWDSFGTRLSPPSTDAVQQAGWKLAATAPGDLRAIDRRWVALAPWGAPPPLPPPPPPPPPPPAPQPIGIVASRLGPKAVFIAPGGVEFHLARGEKLPGGGRLVSITRMRIVWIDRDGKKREHELLADALAPASPPGM